MELPFDILSDQILCRLPVKHLLRCRCVSKGWCSLIDSNAFVKKHFKRMTKCNARGLILDGPCGQLYLADMDSLDDDSASVAELDGALETLFYGPTVVGSADGLVCLKNGFLSELWLFNPATRKVKKIPSAPSEFPNSPQMKLSCGFGYDYVNDDYKVLKIAHNDDRGMKAVILYSNNTGNWTWIEDFPGNIRHIRTSGIYASGSLYFSARTSHGSYIISRFDFGLQQFEEVPFPSINGNSLEPTRSWLLVPFEGSLTIILDCCSDSCMEVWSLNHCRAGYHWSKAFSVEVPRGFGLFGWFVPVAFSRNKKDVLFKANYEKLVWYNIERKTLEDVKIHGILTGVECLYTESLFQLTEGNLVQKPSKGKRYQQKERDDLLSGGFKLSL